MPGDLTAIGILNRLRHLDVAVRLDGDRPIGDAPKNAVTKDLRAELSRHKSEIISFSSIVSRCWRRRGEYRL